MLLRRIARPLLAAPFVYDGVQAALHPDDHVEAASEGAALVTDALGAEPLSERRVALLVRAHGAATAAAGLLLAVGRTPRTAALALAAGKARGFVPPQDEAKLVRAMSEVPRLMSAALRLEPQIEALARDLSKVHHVLYLGRGTSYPIALEGALKLKEISYIHAEGYAAGELKHGPIALIDETMPVVVIAPYDRIFEKTVSNMQEVAARGGRIILVTDPKGRDAAAIEAVETLILPEMPSSITPLVYTIPVQLLAYHTAVFMGTDVDQPRNLAKSVTVE